MVTFYWHIHDVIRDVERKKEREKERKRPEANGKMKMRVASDGIRTHDTLLQTDALPTELPRGSPDVTIWWRHIHVHVNGY